MESSIFTLTVSGQWYLQYFIMLTSGSEVALTCSYEMRRGDEAVDVDVAVHDPPLRSYPVLHDAHLWAPLLVQSDPVAGDPLLHVHVYAAHAVPLRKYPVLHDAQMWAPLLVQSDPVAGDPLLHVHEYASHEAPLVIKYPTLHDAHLAPLLVHADPVAGDPLLHVHVFFAQVLPVL
jgi:hypothetical protein